MNRTGRTRDGVKQAEQGPLMRRLSLMRAKIWDGRDEPRELPAISLDHPKREESILFPEYTFRVETASPEPVEISIDGEGWKECRRSVGYWWYDWSEYQSGLHQAVVRVRPRGREKTASQTCLFRVDLPSAPPAVR